MLRKPDDLYSVLQVELAEAAVAARSCRNSPQQSQEAFANVEKAALTAEQLFTGLSLSRDAAMNQWSRGFGKRIGATIRVHKRYLVQPGHPSEPIASSLLNALKAVQSGDWNAVAIEDAPPPARTLLRRFGPRVLLALLLIAAAFTVPHFAFFVAPQNSGRLEASLLVYAFFALIAPDISKVRDTVLQFYKPSN
jgi:hypothetical protein